MAQNTVLYYATRQVRGPGDHDPGYGKPRRSAPWWWRTADRLPAALRA